MNMLLCAGRVLECLLALMVIWRFLLFTKTYNSIDSCGAPCTFVGVWIRESEGSGLKVKQLNRELLLD